MFLAIFAASASALGYGLFGGGGYGGYPGSKSYRKKCFHLIKKKKRLKDIFGVVIFIVILKNLKQNINLKFSNICAWRPSITNRRLRR